MRKLKLRQVRLLAKHYITSRQPKIQVHVSQTPKLNSLSPVKMWLSLGKEACGTLSVIHTVMKWTGPTLSWEKLLLKKPKGSRFYPGKERGQKKGWWPVTSRFCPALDISGGLHGASERREWGVKNNVLLQLSVLRREWKMGALLVFQEQCCWEGREGWFWI